MLPPGRALALIVVCAAACSLQSLDALNRCEETPEAPDCALPSAGQGGSAAGATSGAGGTTQASGAGGAEEAGGTSGADAGDGGTSTVQGGAGGAAPECTTDDECAEYQICQDDQRCGPGLELLYENNFVEEDNETFASSGMIKPDFEIVNRLGYDVPLAEVRLRYYYSLEAADAETYQCFFLLAQNNCTAEVTITFGGDATNHYFDLTFPDNAFSITARGGTTELISLGITKEDFSHYDQTNDYSFRPEPGRTTQENITLYVNDVPVWGIEP